MAKKADLLTEAKELGLELTSKNTIAELEAAIAGVSEQSAEPKQETPAKSEPKIAKAGKRSAKAIAETEEKVAKEIRKTEVSSDEEPKKNPRPKTRTLLERRSKKYKEVSKKLDSSRSYSLDEAVKLACETSTTKFDASVELHIRLNVDPKHADQNIRDSIVLPEGTGKTSRVAVFADDDDVKKAKDAGADIAGNEDFLAQLEKEIIDFDVLIAVPTMMVKLSKYARLLGPKGLMPNPKSGTVTTDVVKAINESKGGKVEYRVDEAGIVHLSIGKVSFGAERLLKNAKTVVESIQGNKPASVKSNYFLTCFATSSMGPSVKFDI